MNNVEQMTNQPKSGIQAMLNDLGKKFPDKTKNSESLKNGLGKLSKTVLGKGDQETMSKFLKLGEFDKAVDILSNEKLLKNNLDELNMLRTKISQSGLSSGVGGAGVGLERVDAVASEYTKLGANGKYKMRSLGSMISGNFKESIAEKGYIRGFFSGMWKSMKTSLLYSKLKKHKKLLELYPDLRQTAGNVAAKGKKIKETVDKTKKTVKGVMDPLRENPATKNYVKNLKNQYKQKMANIFRGGKKISPEVLKKSTVATTQEIAEKGMKHGGADFVKEVKKGGFPGFQMRLIGKFMAVEILSKGLLRAIRNRDIGSFAETITDSNVWVEAIPIVGSYKSVARLFSDNGDPMWMKLTDTGMNVLGDGLLVAGLVGSVFTAGATGVGGVAARAGVLAAGKGILKKGAMNVAQKQVQKTTIKQGAKLAIKGTTKFALSTAKMTGVVTLTMFLAEEILKQVFTEKTVSSVVTDTVMNEQQQRLVSTFEGGNVV